MNNYHSSLLLKLSLSVLDTKTIIIKLQLSKTILTRTYIKDLFRCSDPALQVIKSLCISVESTPRDRCIYLVTSKSAICINGKVGKDEGEGGHVPTGYLCSVSLHWYKKWSYLCQVITYPPDHDDVIKWKYSPRYWLFVRGIHRSGWIPHTKASDAELWCFLCSASE